MTILRETERGKDRQNELVNERSGEERKGEESELVIYQE